MASEGDILLTFIYVAGLAVSSAAFFYLAYWFGLRDSRRLVAAERVWVAEKVGAAAGPAYPPDDFLYVVLDKFDVELKLEDGSSAKFEVPKNFLVTGKYWDKGCPERIAIAREFHAYNTGASQRPSGVAAEQWTWLKQYRLPMFNF